MSLVNFSKNKNSIIHIAVNTYYVNIIKKKPYKSWSDSLRSGLTHEYEEIAMLDSKNSKQKHD